MVALLGQYTVGFAHNEQWSGLRWTMNPYVFDNTYYKEVLLGDQSKYLKTGAEHLLFEKFKPQCERYAQDQDRFFYDFALAWGKLSELGQERNLLSEFEASDMHDGGYLENKEGH